MRGVALSPSRPAAAPDVAEVTIKGIMQWTTAVQGVVIVLGLGLGLLFPRVRGVSFTKDALINLTTGAILWPVRLALTLAGVKLAQGAVPGLKGFVHLGTFVHPGLQFLLCFLLLDLAKYWLHRADHQIPALWRFHRVHHSTENIDATAGLRMHVVDFLQLTALPILLFGVLLDVSQFEAWVLPVCFSIGIVADGLSHMNVAFPLTNPVFRTWLYTFNNPLFHAWHHTRDGVLCDGNYANALPVWDVLFGSNVTQQAPPALYGIEGDQRLINDVIGLQLLRGHPSAGSDRPEHSR